MQCLDGSYRWILSRGKATFTNEETPVWMAGVHIDYTEQYHADEFIKLSFDASPVGLLLVNENGQILMVNKTLLKIFGYEDQNLKGNELETLLPNRFRSNHTQLFSVFMQNPSKKIMGSGRDLQGIDSEGKEFPVEVGLNPIETSEGLHVLATVIDLSERKRTEKKLSNLNKALVSSNQELRQFAYVASHDLQTPLRSIAGFAQFLKSEYHGKLDLTADDYIERIVGGCERLQKLITALLSYSRIESDDINIEKTDLNCLVDNIFEYLEPSYLSDTVRITKDTLPTLSVDPNQFTQLLQNLIENGLKYNNSAEPTVHVSAQKEGDKWTISVKDNGIGIAQEHQDRIFEIFRRLHNEKAYPGTGIGLALCQKIVHRHYGIIEVKSSEHNGSVFSVILPDTAK